MKSNTRTSMLGVGVAMLPLLTGVVLLAATAWAKPSLATIEYQSRLSLRGPGGLISTTNNPRRYLPEKDPPPELVTDLSVECGTGNDHIDGAIGQSFSPQSFGVLNTIAIWIGPLQYDVTEYRLEVFLGEFEILLGTSDDLLVLNSVKDSNPPGISGFQDFTFSSTTTEQQVIMLTPGETYSWKLIRVSNFSGLFAPCPGDQHMNGTGFRFADADSRQNDRDYSFRLLVEALPDTRTLQFASSPQDIITDLSVDCTPGNLAINGAIGQTFFPQTFGWLYKISIWMKPELYYVTTYKLEVYAGAFESLVGTSDEISVNPSQPSPSSNLTPGSSKFYDFDFFSSLEVILSPGDQYAWKLVRVSEYSGAFARCGGDIIQGTGYWLGSSPENGSRDYSFQLMVKPLAFPSFSPSSAPTQITVMDVVADCAPGNVGINNAIGQTFVPQSFGILHKIAIWIKPNLYYITSYKLQVYTGAFDSLLDTSEEISINPLDPVSSMNLSSGLAQDYHFTFASTEVLTQGDTYSWKLIKTSEYSGAFALCPGNVVEGQGYWLGTYPENGGKDYAFKLMVHPLSMPIGLPTSSTSLSPSVSPNSTPSSSPTLSAQPTLFPSSQPSLLVAPSSLPSLSPSLSARPSAFPSLPPSESAQPTLLSLNEPSVLPSDMPSLSPSLSARPSAFPSLPPSESAQPTLLSLNEPLVLTSYMYSLSPSLNFNPSALASEQPSGSINPTSSSSPTLEEETEENNGIGGDIADFFANNVTSGATTVWYSFYHANFTMMLAGMTVSIILSAAIAV